MKENTKSIGERSEAVILALFLMNSEVVLQPFGDNQRYDLVVDRDGVFLRIQCKTGRLMNGVITFCTSSSAGGKGKRSYIGEVDYFAVFCPENNNVYLVPIKDCPKSSMRLRVDPPVNNSSVSTVNWAKDYVYGQYSIKEL